MNRQILQGLQVISHHRIIIFRPDRPAFLNEGIFALGIATNPVEVLAAQELVIVARRQVLQVFSIRVRLPPFAGLVGVALSFRHLFRQLF